MRKYKKAAGLLAVSLVISMCSGCVMDREKSSESQAGETANLTDEDAEIKKAAKQDINEIHLRDKDTLYENDDETSVVTMYLTVSRGNVSENTDHSWKEINNYSVYDYDHRNCQCTHHVQKKQLPVRFKIRQKNLHLTLIFKVFLIHLSSPYQYSTPGTDDSQCQDKKSCNIKNHP